MAGNLELDAFENEGGATVADKVEPEATEETPSETVVLATGPLEYGPFVLSHLGLPDLTAEGAVYTREQADEVMTLGIVCGVQVVEKRN